MLDWSNLQADYERLGTQTEVAKLYGCRQQLVQKAMKRLGIKATPSSNKGRVVTWTPERLRAWSNLQDDYDRLGTIDAVAAEYGCSKKVVYTAMGKLDVIVNPVKGRKFVWSDERRESFKVGQNTPAAKEAHRAALLRRFEESRVTGPSAGSPLEALLHGALKRAGLSFTTQRRKLNRYVIDIELTQSPVIIEADGLTHRLERQKAKDVIRDAALTEAGYRVFRFDGTQINADPDACIRKVIEAVGLTPDTDPVFDIRRGGRGKDNPSYREGARTEHTCTQCGTVFVQYRVNRSHKKTFCTQKCYGAWMSAHPEQSPVHVRWAKHRAQQVMT